MTSRSGSWMIGFGTAVAFLGVCFLPAAFGPHPDGNVLGMGASIFSLGALTIAGGVYVKAQVVKSSAGAPVEIQRKVKNPCELCKNDPPVVHCKVHNLHLCANCLSEHYDFRSCVYTPSSRSAAGKPSKSMTARAR